MPGIFRSAISRSYGYMPHPLERGAAVGRDVHVVLGERQRLRQQIAMLASSSTTRTRGRAVPVAGRGPAPAAAGAARAAARALAVEPGVDVALAEAPLAADAHRRNLAGLDQPVDGAKIDLEVLQDLFGGEKRFVNHALASRRRCAGSSTVNTAPPSGWFAADDLPAVLLDDAVGDRQPEAGALADLLRRVERLEDARQRVSRGMPVAGVAHGRRTMRSPSATVVVISMRPGRPVAAIACSAFITMLRNTWCSSSGSLWTRGSFSS